MPLGHGGSSGFCWFLLIFFPTGHPSVGLSKDDALLWELLKTPSECKPVQIIPFFPSWF